METTAIRRKLQAWAETLGQEMEKGQTQAFLRWLEMVGKFHRYSFLNTLSILIHRPDASQVAGLRRWNQMGRRVRKGERGIPILVPLLKKVEEDGVEVRKLVGFRSGYVFDVSQTEGEPLPVPPPISGDSSVFDRLVACCPFPVREVPGPVGRLGSTDGQTIELAPGEPTQKASTLLHEWAHCLMHFPAPSGAVPQLRELEGEAVAYVVGRELGLGMEGSRDYILHWQGSPGSLEGSLERILATARQILEQVQPAGERESEVAE
jgi:hypothetical protein